MLIKRYSGSYINNTDNFVIICSDPRDSSLRFRQSQLYGVLCVVQNIIQRGAPSNLSEYLKTIFPDNWQVESNYLISDIAVNWNKTIKGDQNRSDYPAITFFNKIIPQYLKDYKTIRNLIVPEADFDEVVGEKTGFTGQKVDFYFPSIETVIEIDGASHKTWQQDILDQERDHEMERHGIQTIRIPTQDIRTESDYLKHVMFELNNRLSASKEIEEYKKSNSEKRIESTIRLETIMRLQMALLFCMREQFLDCDSTVWRISICESDVMSIEEDLQIAYEDIQQWMDPIVGMLKLDYTFPKIEIARNSEAADLVLDYSLYRRYDDTCIPASNKIIVRSDYYRNRNYYQVAVSDTLLKYKLETEDDSEDTDRMRFLLTNIFGFRDFNTGQRPIIENVLMGNDTVGILPTGAGKSLCYQFSAILQPGVTVIIDPIISLMTDQKKSMRERYHITRNEMISSLQSGEEKNAALDQFQKGKYQMLWVSPERFQIEEFRNSLSEINTKLNFCLAVIDEVHCLSEWGHDFRVSYLALVRTLKKYCPTAVLLGLTATASEFVLQDIRVEFADKNGQPLDVVNVKTSVSQERKELLFHRISVKDQKQREAQIRRILEENTTVHEQEQGLVFCPTVNGRDISCAEMSNVLAAAGIDFRVFYGKLDQKTKEENQKDYMNGQFPYMICTKAFGMGVDNQRIWCTIHNSLPASIESFYQEAGRAARDVGRVRIEHKTADCYIIYHVGDRERAIVKQYEDEDNLLDLLDDDNGMPGDSDLNTPLYFLRSNYMPEEEECAYIAELLQYLGNDANTEHTIPFKQETKDKYLDKQTIEKALYKLSLLKIVNDWTVNYRNSFSGTIVVDITDVSNISPENLFDTFLDYVKKYDYEFSLDSDRGREYLEIYEQSDNKKFNVVQMLVRWTNKNIVYQRIRCMKTMMDWCSEEVTDDDFRNNIVSYFKFSDKTMLLENIAHDPLNYAMWFDCLRDKDGRYISFFAAKDIYAGLQRFLESYQNNTGLNYLDGLLLLFIKDNISIDDLSRMSRSLDVINNMGEIEKNDIIAETLQWGKRFTSLENKDVLSSIILKHCPCDARMLFNSLNDRYSLSIEMDRMMERMENIKWII